MRISDWSSDVCSSDLTGDERRVPGYPVAHDDASARAGHAHHLARSVERPGGEHRAKHADHQIETPVGEIIERRSVALLEMKIVQSRFTGATNACRDRKSKRLNYSP